MYINRVFETVKFLANTDGRGNFRPTDFNLALNNTILEKYDAYLTEINQLVNRENRGLINGGLENVPDRIREKLLHFLSNTNKSKVSGYFALPDDLRYFDTIINATTGNKEEVFELCKSMEEFNIIKSVNATKKYPICLKTSNGIKVAPDASFDTITIYYLRNPKFAKWTFIPFGGAEMFNPSANDFQDIDMHPSEEVDLIRGVCLRMGINLKEQELQAAMQNQDQIEFNRNNAS